MSGTDEPRHTEAIMEDSDTDTEEVLATTAVSATEETPVTTVPLPRNSCGHCVRHIPAPDPLLRSQTQTPLPPPSFTLSPPSLSYLPTPPRELFTGPNPTMDVPTGQRPVRLLPNRLKRKGHNLQIQVNTSLLPNAVTLRPTNLVQFLN